MPPLRINLLIEQIILSTFFMVVFFIFLLLVLFKVMSYLLHTYSLIQNFINMAKLLITKNVEKISYFSLIHFLLGFLVIITIQYSYFFVVFLLLLGIVGIAFNFIISHTIHLSYSFFFIILSAIMNVWHLNRKFFWFSILISKKHE